VENVYNIYCDESCHLENDGQKAMVLGAIWVPKIYATRINRQIREIKSRHGYDDRYELKWVRISKRNLPLYLELIEYFFNKNTLRFRAIVIPEKEKLNHSQFQHKTHDNWYYRMYFRLIRNILRKDKKYHIYLDIKDTCSQKKVEELQNVLANSIYDFDHRIIERIQSVDSTDISILQLGDILIGALSYFNRGLKENEAKVAIVEKIKACSGLNLGKSTLPSATKLNIFVWSPQTICGEEEE